MGSILKLSEWSNLRRGSCVRFQVLPHPQRPGVFSARLIIKERGTPPPKDLTTWNAILSQPEIAALSLHFKKEGAAKSPIPLSAEEALSLLPARLKDASTAPLFSGEIEAFLISENEDPKFPAYPFWTKHVQRGELILQGKYAEIIPPMSEFIPTLNCNFRCFQCSYRQPKEQLGVWERNRFEPRFHMDPQTMRVVLQQLKDGGVENILFTGGGEPLFNEDTPSAMRYAAQDLGLKVALYTNGALITERVAEEILGVDPVFIRVSLNAGRTETHRKHHSPIDESYSLATVLNGIEHLARTKGKKGKKEKKEDETTLGISYLVHPDNAEDVVAGARQIATLAEKYPETLDYMRFTPSVDYFGGSQHPEELFGRVIEQIEREAAPLLASVKVNPMIYHHRFAGLYEPRAYNQCLASGFYGEAGPRGILYHCCEKLFQDEFTYGSLLDSSFREVWLSEQRRRVFEFVNRAVRGETESPCPPVCKPHELNKIFAEIERLRSLGKIAVVKDWLRQIHAYIKDHPRAYVAGRLDGFQS